MKRDFPVAFSVTVSGFGQEVSIVAGINAGRARYRVYLSMRDAGYQARFQDIKVRRAPQYDQLAAKLNKEKRSIGLWYADQLLLSKEGVALINVFCLTHRVLAHFVKSW